MKVLVTQSSPTLCDPKDCSPPGSSVHGILQARIVEWVIIPLSRGFSQPRDQSQVSHIAGRFFTVGATRETQNCIKMTPFSSTLIFHYYDHYYYLAALGLCRGVWAPCWSTFSCCPAQTWLSPRGLWNLSSPTRDWTHNLCTGQQILKHWTTREVPIHF